MAFEIRARQAALLVLEIGALGPAPVQQVCAIRRIKPAFVGLKLDAARLCARVDKSPLPAMQQ